MRGIALLLVCLSVQLQAQLVNDGATFSITEETIVSGLPNLTNSGAIINDGDLQLTGNFTNLNTYQGIGALSLVGASQLVDLNDTVATLAVAGSGIHELSSSLLVSEKISLSTALLRSNDQLTLLSNATSQGGSDGYVIGSLIRNGLNDIQMPIGTESAYLPVNLSGLSGTSGSYVVEAISSDPDGIAGYGLLEVSGVNYWSIENIDGSLDDYTAELPMSNSLGLSSVEELRIGLSTDGTTFHALDQLSTSGTFPEGTISSVVRGVGRLALGQYFNEQLRVADSVALVAIYESTNGDLWNDRSGWITSDLDEWYGLTLDQKRPIAIDLSGNNLTGEIASISVLDSLQSLNLSNNKLTSISNFSNLNSLNDLDISNNEIQFADIEQNLGVANFTYAPQDSVLSFVETIEEIGSTYTLTRQVSGSDNSYVWYKAKGETTNQLSSSMSSQDVSINSFDDEGLYYAEVSSSIVPDLTLITRPIFLKVSSLERDSIALRAVYDKMNGAEWTSVGSNWTTSSLANWSGVTIEDSRVTGLSLLENNLSGSLPRDILDIRNLEQIDLSGNQINAIPNFNRLTRLEQLDVSDNNLDFGDLEPVATLASINYVPQKLFGSVVNDTLEFGSAVEFNVSVAGSANEYQWSFEGELMSGDLDGAISDSYQIQSLEYENMGTYTLNVTNDLVPGLILESVPKTVLASGNVRFTAMNAFGDPVNSGTAYLLRVIANQPYDSLTPVSGSPDGFEFQNVVLGNYLAAVEGDLALYLPTYFPSTDLWSESEPIEIRSNVEDTITLVSQPGTGPIGDGQVNGIVESEFVEEGTSGRVNARRKVKRAGCSVRRFVPRGRADQEDGDFVLVAYVQSDDEGRFEFSDLASGLYRFNVEYPGVPMDEDSYVEFEIGADGIENNTIVLEILITEEAITVVKVDELGFFRKYFDGLEVYPNPADQYLTIEYEKLLSESVEVELMNLSGQVLKTTTVTKGFERSIELNVSDLQSGMYLLHFKDQSNQNKSVLTYKIFVSHK